jgi:hypothetical protein
MLRSEELSKLLHMYEDALISFDTQCTIQHRCILGVFVVSLIEGCSDASLLQASAILIGGMHVCFCVILFL